MVRHGANTVTTLVEKKKAQLVVIANDVDPIEVFFYIHLSYESIFTRILVESSVSLERKITIYLLVARHYKGELLTLLGIYFSELIRDFFDEISSRVQARGEMSSKSRENTMESKFPVKYSSPEGNF